MFTPKGIGILAMVIFCVVVIFLFRQPADEIIAPGTGAGTTAAPGVVASSPPKTPSSPRTIEEKAGEIASDDPRLARFSDGSRQYNVAVERSRELHKSTDPEEDLHLVSQLFDDYRFFFQSNPVGSENYEIVAQLLGENEERILFLDRSIGALTSDGLLLDRWGTPYVFHPLTSTEMGVRSSGPDQELWTGDDLSLDKSNVEEELQLYPSEG